MLVVRRLLVLAAALALTLPLLAAPAAVPAWVERSNANAKLLLDIQARYGPEGASAIGVEGYDAEVSQLPPDLNAKMIAETEGAIKQLEARLAKENDPAVRQDLQILIHAANEFIEGTRLSEKYDIPYFNLSQTFFNGTRALLDDRVAPERRLAIVTRLRKYAGMEEGYTPLTEQAMAWTRASMKKNASLRGPFRDNLEKDLANSERYVAGIEQLLKKYDIKDADAPFAELKKQLAAYNAFVRAELQPRASTDFRLPEEMYRYQLKSRGNDMPVEELVSRAKTSFREIQNEMQALAPLVAKEKGFTSTDYRDVIRNLKKKQFAGDAILPHYQARIKEIEKIIREQKMVTLPQREMVIRLASEAETAAVPAPHVDPPRLIGNTGEMAAFVLPLRIPGEDGKIIGFDDFTFDAASWTLTVHEGRPGHELQFASVLEKGVSQARVLYAFNSVNVEGWALYAEAEMKPLEPLDGQLIALQHRLMRAARAFLDPSLQLGRMNRDEAFRVLEDDVVLSHAMALQEVERYTFWAPGQAPSYFVGYSRLVELRTDAERMLGKSFDRQSYHDFILGQGLLPPALLRDAVLNEYIKPRLK